MLTNRSPADELRSLRDRIVRLEEDKKSIGDDIKDVYAEAKGRGYDVKALRITVKRQMESVSDKRARQETEAIAELYLASLGMLDGTPLGEAARKRAAAPPPSEPGPDGEPEQEGDGTAERPEPPEPEAPPATIGPEEIDAARERGREDARSGKRIVDNPFVAGDPRRAAWDEGHCEAMGSDGMDIPPPWRRLPKKRKGEEPEPAEGGEG